MLVSNRRLGGILLALLGFLAPAPVIACTVGENYNEYEDLYDPSPADLFAKAHTVDWVRIAPRGAYRCLPERGNRTCENASPPAEPFEAVVIERLKGASPSRFYLPLEDDAYGRPWDLSDIRSQDRATQAAFAVTQKAIADGRHRAVQFWSSRGVGIAGYPGGCSLNSSADPRMRYIVFRNGDGAVIGLEPVLHEDDVLLTRLRLAKRDVGALVMSYPVDAFFRNVRSAAVAQVERCPTDWESATVRPLRGHLETPLGIDNPPVTEGLRTYAFLGDQFAAARMACPAGEIILAFAGAGPSPLVEADFEWGERSVPGYTIDRSKYDPDGIALHWDAGLPYAVVVRAGKIRLDEVPTRLRLTGPAEISVDQAFAWIEEGKVGRATSTGRKVQVWPRTPMPPDPIHPKPNQIIFAIAAALICAGLVAFGYFASRADRAIARTPSLR